MPSVSRDARARLDIPPPSAHVRLPLAGVGFPTDGLRDPTFGTPARVLAALQLFGASFEHWTRPLGPKHIADLCGVSRGAARHALPGLERRGYIERGHPTQVRGGIVFRYRLTFLDHGDRGIEEVGE